VASLGKVVRGGFWLYASTVVSNLLGLAYWMAISAVGGAALGYALVGAAVLAAGAYYAPLDRQTAPRAL